MVVERWRAEMPQAEMRGSQSAGNSGVCPADVETDGRDVVVFQTTEAIKGKKDCRERRSFCERWDQIATVKL